MSAAEPSVEPQPREGRADVLSGLAVVLLGVVLLVSALGIPGAAGPGLGIGPGLLPTVLAGGLVLTGALLAASGVRRLRSAGPATAPEDRTTAEQVADVMGDEPPVPGRRLAVMVLLLVAYAIAFIPLGYVWSTMAYLVATVTLVDPQRWRRNLLFAVVFAFVVYYGFTQLLAVELPLGPFLLPGV